MTRWEYVGECLQGFYANKANYFKFAKAIRNCYNSSYAKNEIASEFLSLVQEEGLISMGVFLLGFYNSFWNHHFIILKQVDEIAKSSGYICRHMPIIYYVMEKELQQLELSYVTSNDFSPYLNRRSLHSIKEQKKIYDNLPSLFFAKLRKMLKKHFHQWVSEKNLQFLLASEQSISISFCC